VNAWNTFIQNKYNTNAAVTYISYDCYDGVDDPHGHLASTLRSQDVLNRFCANGVPQHQLSLKVGDICLLLRTIAPEMGLTTNTRVKIVSLYERSVRVQKLSDGTFHNIPKINFTIKLPYGKSFKMRRSQIPLALAYAMTINKSQGQEFDRVLVDLTSVAFSHGHLYVALSRIRKPTSILIFVKPDNLNPQGSFIYTQNVVYKRLLLRQYRIQDRIDDRDRSDREPQAIHLTIPSGTA
jgi:ATP-dependent DNA helicase PIF1